MRKYAVFTALLLVLISAGSVLALGETQTITATLTGETKVVSTTASNSVDGNNDVVIQRSSRVPGIEQKLAELESEWRRLNRRSHIDYRARQRANALSVQIISLRGAIGAERTSRIDADRWEKSRRVAGDRNLSGQIASEARTRQTGDEGSTLLIVCLCGILLVGSAYVATSR